MCYRENTCLLDRLQSRSKVACFDGRTHDGAVGKQPRYIPVETWEKLVGFWESDKGQLDVYD